MKQFKCACGRTLYISDQPPRQGRMRRPRRPSQSQGYAHEVEAVQPWEAPPAQPAQLEPGETRERNRYQNETVESVKVKLLRTAPYCVLTTLLSIAAPLLLDAVPWWTPLGVLPVSGLAAWSVIDWKGFDPLVAAEKLTRLDLNGDGIIGETDYYARGEVKDGQTSIYTRFKIPDPWAWYAFCKDVHAGANFSQRTAKSHEIEPPVFKAIVRQWKSPDPKLALIDPDSVGERKKLRLTRAGKLMVKSFALTPPREV